MSKTKEVKNEFVYTEEVTGEIVNIPIKLLHHHHQNPRKEYGELTELADSIKQNGVFQNLTVVPFWFDITGVGCDTPEQQAEMGYLVVIGNRRLEAAKIAGLETLPCIISDMSHKEQLSTMLVENMQRCDLTVYEQAQGFQMMIDMGESVESIAEKSGFSESTVRRRVKLAELDQDKLKKVSTRQISMADFEKLNQIKDIDERNKVLEKIGTADFNNEIKRTVAAEERKERQDLWREKLLSLGLKELSYSEAQDWQKYTSCNRNWFDITCVSPDEFSVTDEEYFAFVPWNSNIYFKKKKQDTKPVNEDPKVIAAREKEEQRQRQLEELNKRMYELRKEFCDSVTVTALKKHIADMVAFFIYNQAIDPCYMDEENVIKTFELETYTDDEGYERFDYQNVLQKVQKSPETAIWKMILLHVEDSHTSNFTDWRGEYKFNFDLDMFYKLLITLGYEMSEEEKQWADGTHPLYIKGE